MPVQAYTIQLRHTCINGYGDPFSYNAFFEFLATIVLIKYLTKRYQLVKLRKQERSTFVQYSEVMAMPPPLQHLQFCLSLH